MYNRLDRLFFAIAITAVLFITTIGWPPQALAIGGPSEDEAVLREKIARLQAENGVLKSQLSELKELRDKRLELERDAAACGSERDQLREVFALGEQLFRDASIPWQQLANDLSSCRSKLTTAQAERSACEARYDEVSRLSDQLASCQSELLNAVRADRDRALAERDEPISLLFLDKRLFGADVLQTHHIGRDGQ